jgi:hypothetical protein
MNRSDVGHESSSLLARLGAAMLALVLLVGCGGKQEYSGFLGDYSGLEPYPAIDGAKVYRAPGLQMVNYSKFIVDPVGVEFAPDANGATINVQTLNELTAYFRQSLITELSKKYQVVEQPGPGVMRLRFAITDLKKAQPLANIHPLTKLSGIGLGGATVEAEGVDTSSDERMFAFVHRREGDRLSLAEGMQDWGHARQAMDYWAKKLVERLDNAHGKTNK